MKPQLKDELADLKRQIVLMTRMLGLVKVETNDKRKPSQGPQRNKDESIPRQDPRMEGSEADPPMDPPATMAAQAGNPFRGVGANGPDFSGGEDGEDGSKKAREIVADGLNSAIKEANSAQRRPSTPSPPPRGRRGPSRSPPEPARYAYGAWTIRCKVTTTYLIEKAPAGQPELEKIAQKHQSASNLSSLVALPPRARKAVNKFLGRLKSSEASLVVMEPLKKRWNPFRWCRQERPMALLVLRLREDGLGDGRSVSTSSYSSSPDRRDARREREVERDEIIIRRDEREGRGPRYDDYEREEVIIRRDDDYDRRPPPPRNFQREEIFISRDEREDDRRPPPPPPPAEEVPSTPEPPLPSQEEAEDLMAQYLTSFTAGPAEGGTQAREDEQMASKEGVNGTDNVVGTEGQ